MVFTVVALLTPLVGDAPTVAVLDAVLILSIPVYFLVAQKRVYGQGWIKTALKAAVLSVAYNTVLLVGLVAVFFLAALFG